MTQTPAATGEARRRMRRVATASLIGTAIEWYDFYIYGTAAALVFPKLFFPDFSPGAGLLASLSTFAVGFIARPLGGVVFGHFGDRVGRKKMLVITLLAMGLSTLAIGLMPGYASIGLAAPVLIVVLRFIQGFAVGGEWGGAVLMAVEHAPEGRRGFYGSWPQIGSPLGLVLSTSVFGAASLLPDAAFDSWGWRVPFLLSVVLIAVGMIIRLRLVESPVFAAVVAQGSRARVPFVQAVRHHAGAIAAAAGSFIIINTVFYLVTVLTMSWVTTELSVPRSTFLGAVLVAALCMCVTVPFFGALSDKLGRRRVFASGAALVAVFGFPLYALIETRSAALIWLGVFVVMALGHAAMYGPQGALYSEMFPPALRYTGASLGYQIGGMIGGLVPLAAQALLLRFDGASWPMAALLSGLAVVSLLSVLMAKARYQDGAGVADGTPAAAPTDAALAAGGTVAS